MFITTIKQLLVLRQTCKKTLKLHVSTLTLNLLFMNENLIGDKGVGTLEVPAVNYVQLYFLSLF